VIDPPPLLEFVALSMLLHLLLLVLFGNPIGSMRRNEGGLGPLDVMLGPRTPEPGSQFRLAPGLETSSPGSALLPRPGATSVPAASPRRAIEPPPTPPASVEALPRLSPSAPEEVDKPLAPAAASPATIEPIAPPTRARELAPPVELPPRSVPALPATPIETPIAPRSEPQLAPAVEMPQRALPASPAAPLEPSAPPSIERELAPAKELPLRETPAAPAVPLERLAPAPPEREVLPPVELPARTAPAVPAAPIERLAPAPIEREIAPAVQVPLRPSARPAAPLATPAPSTQLPSAPQLPSTPALTPTPAAPAQILQRPGPPAVEEDIFKSRRDISSPPAEAPRIDLDAARKKAAREIVTEGTGSRGVFTIPAPPPVERKSKEASALEKAIKPDCRTAYADMGLLAVPVLVASAIAADGSCRW
jgi:hypothetical protein